MAEIGEETPDSSRENGSAQQLNVRCPHYEECEFGRRKAKNNRPRCYGTLIKAVTESARVALSYKCQLSKRVMPMVINGRNVWHIKPQSSEHNWLIKLMEVKKCQHCDHRVFDAHIFMGRAKIFIKCSKDGQQLVYHLVAAGQQQRQQQ